MYFVFKTDELLRTSTLLSQFLVLSQTYVCLYSSAVVEIAKDCIEVDPLVWFCSGSIASWTLTKREIWFLCLL